MSDTTLKRSSVTINYTASDGYRSAVNYSNRGQMGWQPPPELPLLDAIEELSRLCALFGFGDQAAQRVADARERVDAWRAARSKTHNDQHNRPDTAVTLQAEATEDLPWRVRCNGS